MKTTTFLLLFICSAALGQDSLLTDLKGKSIYSTGITFHSTDTSKVVMLVSKKEILSSQQGYISFDNEVFCTNYGVAFTIRGYAVIEKYSSYVTYLDNEKKPIKNLIIWISISEKRLTPN